MNRFSVASFSFVGLSLVAGCHQAKPASSAVPVAAVRLLTHDLPTVWYQAEAKPIFLADVLEEGGPSPMSAGFARYGAGAANDWTVHYDEVLIVTSGVFSVVVAGRATTARAGELLFLPKGTTLTYRAEEPTELVYVSYPHWAPATKRSEHAAALDAFHPVPASVTKAARVE